MKFFDCYSFDLSVQTLLKILNDMEPFHMLSTGTYCFVQVMLQQLPSFK